MPVKPKSEKKLGFHEIEKPTTYATFFRGQQNYGGVVENFNTSYRSSRRKPKRVPWTYKEVSIPYDRMQNLQKIQALGDIYTSTYKKAFTPLFGVASSYPKQTSEADILENWKPWEKDPSKRNARYEELRKNFPEDGPVFLDSKTESRKAKFNKRFQYCFPDNQSEVCPVQENQEEAIQEARKRFLESYDRRSTKGCVIDHSYPLACGYFPSKERPPYEPAPPLKQQKKRPERPSDATIRWLQKNLPTPLWLRGVRQTPLSIFKKEDQFSHDKREGPKPKHAETSTFDRSNQIDRGILPSAFPTHPIRILHEATLPKPFEHTGPLRSVPPTFWENWLKDNYEAPPCDEARMRWVTVQNN